MGVPVRIRLSLFSGFPIFVFGRAFLYEVVIWVLRRKPTGEPVSFREQLENLVKNVDLFNAYLIRQ
jgi:hypothetical protein